MKIILADDNQLFRDGLRAMLEPEATCHEAADLRETLAQLAKNPDAGLVLMDLNMPGMAAVQGIDEVRRRHPRIPLVVVSMHDDPAVIGEVLSRGVSGYIPKTHSFEAMRKAIDLVLAGTTYVPEEMLHRGGASPAANPTRLTRRQKDVYDRLMQGKSHQEIADELFISLSTVKMHVGSVLEKAGVDSLAQLLAADRNPFS
jgi:DNA-binding NarL/FixJ family response regulator